MTQIRVAVLACISGAILMGWNRPCFFVSFLFLLQTKKSLIELSGPSPVIVSRSSLHFLRRIEGSFFLSFFFPLFSVLSFLDLFFFFFF
ncbi:hypothetical protein IWZ03DRAFT_370931, partial [Phyllosticta citriasiana]